ncbi:MAG TPA: acyl-CoA thioesterase II [Kofleriaceae bacterium]|nr:acyl-CoA thioesterase II [Kofleriaceae bacterium]
MSAVLDQLVKLLALEQIEQNLFRGQSQDLGWGTVFGGQVLGQALSAAVQTVPAERHVHSLHAYFLRPGDVRRPIVYDVDRIRDGSSFTTRRVVAIQNGHAIFNLAASFQIEEPGLEHADAMPEAPPPDALANEQELAVALGDKLPALVRERAIAERPFEMRPVDPEADLIRPPQRPPHRMVWLRTAGRLPDQPALHRYLLAYASDHYFVTTALLPHGVTWLTPGMQIASLDHVMWFHRAFRVDEWLLHVIDSPAAHGARGLVRGRVFTQDGKLVASTAQEGLLRRR